MISQFKCCIFSLIKYKKIYSLLIIIFKIDNGRNKNSITIFEMNNHFQGHIVPHKVNDLSRQIVLCHVATTLKWLTSKDVTESKKIMMAWQPNEGIQKKWQPCWERKLRFYFCRCLWTVPLASTSSRWFVSEETIDVTWYARSDNRL